ncbi:enoyl-CoA hydratase-related protein [Corynebacterium sputi]|uniref:enoyl-CoA hydratase-related protein n=1 Tax=Corynebacterium sputi TaxID=489915 RepID=UPI001F0B3AE3|nr:enoyl-CoA hydratase-related protein [Corynebacterium sputi]
MVDHTGNTFCAGADLKAVDLNAIEDTARLFIGLLHGIVTTPKPVVAVVDGNVRAGGTGIVAACDIAFASPNSTFGVTEARIGVAPAMITLTPLPKVDPRAAAYHLLSADTFGADEAQRIGLITETVEDPTARANAWSTEALKCSPQGLRETKSLLNRQLRESFDTQSDTLAAKSASLFLTEEAIEGIFAFRERREPSRAAVP